MKAIFCIALAGFLAGCAGSALSPGPGGALPAGAPYGGVWALPTVAFSWPVSGRVLSRFGEPAPDLKSKGIGISAREGAPIVAARAGVVSFADVAVKGYGHMIIVDHADGYQTVYAYNLRNLVVQGQKVERNQVIAFVGSGGRAKKPSLYFEIRKDGVPLNPERYLP